MRTQETGDAISDSMETHQVEQRECRISEAFGKRIFMSPFQLLEVPLCDVIRHKAC